MIKRKVELPLDDNPILKAFLMNNFELGILMTFDTDFMPWFFNHHININWIPNHTENLYFTICEQRWYANEGVMQVNRLRLLNDIYDLRALDLFKALKEMLSNGYYTYGRFNEFYIPQRWSYQRKYFYHGFLLYGYDDDKQEVYLIGYTDKRNYERQAVPYENFLLSINSELENIHFDFPKPNKDFSFKNNLNDIYADLYDYTHSINSKTMGRIERTFGLESHKCFIDHVQHPNAREQKIDLRYSRFFMEHKNLMLLRLQHLESNGIISKGTSESYIEISDAMKTVHNLCLKYNLTLNDELQDRITLLIEKVCNMESKILPQVLTEIKVMIQKQHSQRYK